ncbi:DUF72 domain-containing protein [filamentous cyanobacterium CCP5]|nr:DUF72 domain-containing protein [filamentous cyanobacterium CCP5]
MSGPYYTGCAVWAFKPWVGGFYPSGSQSKDFLQHYCDRLTAVEGNTTFYALPGADTVGRWAAVMPNDFRFCPKLPKFFSHQGPLLPRLPAAIAFAESLLPLGQRLGPIMVQLPPSYGPTRARDLTQFLNGWPRHHWPLAVEVRHSDWFKPSQAQHLNQLLQTLGVGRVLLDTRPVYETPGAADPQMGSERRKPRLPLHPVITAPFTIVRYIGHPHLPSNRPYWEAWIPRLRHWLDQGREVYFFAHCPEEINSPDMARQVYHQLQQTGANLPPLKWDQLAASRKELTDQPQQLSLL